MKSRRVQLSLKATVLKVEVKVGDTTESGDVYSSLNEGNEVKVGKVTKRQIQ